MTGDKNIARLRHELGILQQYIEYMPDNLLDSLPIAYVGPTYVICMQIGNCHFKGFDRVNIAT